MKILKKHKYKQCLIFCTSLKHAAYNLNNWNNPTFNSYNFITNKSRQQNFSV